MSQVDAGDWPRADVNKDYHTTVIVHDKLFSRVIVLCVNEYCVIALIDWLDKHWMMFWRGNGVVYCRKIKEEVKEIFYISSSFCFLAPGGGALEYQGGYQARPKIHVIRVVFQDQALYARTAFRGAKHAKLEKKGVFLVI